MAPDNDSFEGIAPGLGGEDLGIDQTKAKLDDSELSDDLPKSLQKVDLDLDDAPFLEDEEEEEPELAAPETASDEEESEAPAPWWKKKQIVFPGAAAVLLLLGATVYFLFFSAEEPPPPPPVAEEAPVEPAPPPPPALEIITIEMDPFLVEESDAKGHTRFLSVKFSTTTTNPDVEKEIKTNIVVLRDAIYYYLKNKSLTFLADKKNGDALKQDILSVVNQFLSSEQLDNLQIEEYLVK